MAAVSRTGAIIASILMVSTAHAQTTIDVAKISCDQFVNREVADTDNLALWLAGYYAARHGNTRVDLQQLRQGVQELKNHCMYNQDNLMKSAERYLPTSE
jgi:hypothetical protein